MPMSSMDAQMLAAKMKRQEAYQNTTRKHTIQPVKREAHAHSMHTYNPVIQISKEPNHLGLADR